MYDDVATLIANGTRSFDEYGNETISQKGREVYVQPRGIYASEFYNAAQTGLKPSITFVLTNRADYDEEKLIRYHGTLYEVIRVDWKAQHDSISLVCQERIGNAPDEEARI